MIDSDVIAKAVNTQIANSVNQAVIEAFSDPAWIEKIERQLIMYCQKRIMGSFANISMLPEIKQTIKQSVTDLFDQGQIPGIDQYVTLDKIKESVEKVVSSQISSAVVALSADVEWLEKVEKLSAQAMSQRIVSQLQNIDIPSVIDSYVSQILPTLVEKKLVGIKNTSQDVELSVMPGLVVAENTFVASSIEAIDKIGTKNLLVEGDLSVKGSINTDNQSWITLSEAVAEKTLKKVNDQFLNVVKNSITESIKKDGIDFSDVKINGSPLVAGNQLSENIRSSSLESLGRLESLSVKGNADLYDTLHVVNKRIGINTANPENALTVWDDEVSVSVGKKKKDTAYIGTTKNQTLEIGINREAKLTIDTSGCVSVDAFKIKHHSIKFEPSTPGYSGQKGDIVFNSNPRPGDPFMWVCLGNYRWHEVLL